ncbi:hypothetical protein CCYA_CCYA02G0497 [Cyanidiococcus yangmingshanensis]|nr:hypothetical protein CCYA_CCYA02G0497 [Cyanidiococcus yangmingshanensis]
MQTQVWRIEAERLRRLVVEPALKWPKLLVLDLNGFLVWRTPLHPRPGQEDERVGACYQRQPDVVTKRFCIWRRPGAGSFLEYVLAHFHVGVWSTAQRPNVDDILSALLSIEQRKQLVFVMDQSDCTKIAGGRAPGSKHKPLMFKDLNHIWRQFDGFYHLDNTLLIDDDAYKAKHNPSYTSIHPIPWNDPDRQASDTFLEQQGLFRWFLEALRRHDGSVRTFVANQTILPVSETNATSISGTKLHEPETSDRERDGYRAAASSKVSHQDVAAALNDPIQDTTSMRRFEASQVDVSNSAGGNLKASNDVDDVEQDRQGRCRQHVLIADTIAPAPSDMTTVNDQIAQLYISGNLNDVLDKEHRQPSLMTPTNPTNTGALAPVAAPGKRGPSGC